MKNDFFRSVVEMEPGTFRMGATPDPDVMAKGVPDDPSRPHWDEAPPHRVTLTGAFRMARAPGIQQEYARCCPTYRKTLEHYGVAWNPRSPAVMVTWGEAWAYCEWWAQRNGEPCRLPSEAEWEFSARHAGSLGLNGMGTAVYEWCADWWAPYPVQAVTDPVGPASGTVRVIRGGRPSNRAGSLPEDRRPDVGFRPVFGPARAGDRPPAPPRARVFSDVAQHKPAWRAGVPADPFFAAPIPFIQRPADLLSLPYWNRQHVPSVTWCPNGDILATVFTAPKDNSSQMAILLARLRKGAARWDLPARFFIAPDRNVTSAALFTDADGVIHHYNGLGGFDCHDFSLLRRTSADNGATWSAFEIVREHDFGYRGPGMDPVVLRDGTLAMPTDGEKFCGTVLYVSRDNGRTWTERTGQGAFRRSALLANSDTSLAKNPLDAVPLETVTNREAQARWSVETLARKGRKGHWMAGIHAQPVELNDGSLMAIGRGDNLDGYSPLSLSRDGGKTWAYKPSPFPPIGSGQRATLRRLAEGPLLYLSFTDPSQAFYENNPRGIRVTDAAGRARHILGLFAALSLDEGQTWPRCKALAWDGERRFPTEAPDYPAEFAGYLSCAQSPDGMIHMVSSYRYYRFNLAWLNIKGEHHDDPS